VTNVVDEREPAAGDNEEGGRPQPELAGTAPAPGDEARPRAKRRRNRRRRRGKMVVSLSAPTAGAEGSSAPALDTQRSSDLEQGGAQEDQGEGSRPAAENGTALPAAARRRRKKRHGAPATRARRFPLARELREQLRRERQIALDTRDPLAIRLALDRYDVLTAALEGFSDDAEVDLDSITLGISQAAKALGYTPFQVREMIKLRKLAAYKVNNQWRIPLKLVW
jgi:hypothetical protein